MKEVVFLNNGTVKLPAEYLKKLKMDDGNAINVILNHDSINGRVILEKVGDSCVFCHCDMDLIGLLGKFICVGCRDRILDAGAGDCFY